MMFATQEQSFRELEKDFGKCGQVCDSSPGTPEGGTPPAHLHHLLASLHKHLLAYSYSNAQDETVVRSTCILG